MVKEICPDEQARTFLIAYHGARLTKSAKAVEEEQWTQIDVTSSVQHTVDLLVSSATEDSAECFIPPRHDTATNGNANGALAKQLNIEEKGFFVVKATSETLELLADYLKIVINLELVVMDVMSRIIEFLKVSCLSCLLESELICSHSILVHARSCLEQERCVQQVSRTSLPNI